MTSEVYCFDCNKLIGYTSNAAPDGIITCPECEEEEQEMYERAQEEQCFDGSG